jgi:hypothetical protein
MWTGLVWLGIRTGGELLRIRYWTFGFHGMLGNSLVASRVVLSSVETVSSVRTCNCVPAVFSISTIISLNIHLADVWCVDIVKCIKLIYSGFRFVIEFMEHYNRKLAAATCRSHSTALATLFWSLLRSVQVSLPLGPRDVSVFQPQQLSTIYLSN